MWLLKHGVKVTHGRPNHPQTQGKDERFHRTLNAELLSRVDLLDVEDAQVRFDPWRGEYNQERPHEALENKTPATRYRSSVRSYPEREPTVEYDEGECVRRVSEGGIMQYKSVEVRVGKAFTSERVAVRPMNRAGMVRVCFGPHILGELDLGATGAGASRRASFATLTRPAEVQGESATHVSEHV